MIKVSINIIILFALVSLHLHDIIPHEHKHETHSHNENEIVFEEVNNTFIDCDHFHGHSHYEHNFLYFTTKKNEVKSPKNFIKEFSVAVLADDKELKPEYSQIIENSFFSKQLNEFTSIHSLRGPPALIS